MRSRSPSWRRNRLAAAILLAGTVGSPSGAALAEEPAPEQPGDGSPSEMAREGVEKLMRALSLLVESIPQYEMPEVLENGDIIIRRKNPDTKPEEPEIDETAT